MKNKRELRIILTSFCNYRCFFCHAEGLPNDGGALLLSPADYGYIVSVTKEYLGWDTVTITGGEPLLSPIYLETSEKIAQLGVKITTVTNGSLVSSPKKLLQYNHQVNISLHTLDAGQYQRITGSYFPPQNIMKSIEMIRGTFPQMVIHLNMTLLKGHNDTLANIEQILNFAKAVRATVKLIDVATTDTELVVSVGEITELLEKLGFRYESETVWQLFYVRGNEKVIVTRCGFSVAHKELELRNLLLNPDGALSLGSPTETETLDILPEIKQRNTEVLIRKIVTFFPPLHYK